MRQIAALGRSQKLADPLHHCARVVAAPALPPLFDLLGEIGRGLPGERRIGGAEALAKQPMAGRTGRYATLGAASCPQLRRVDPRSGPAAGRQRSVVEGHGFPRLGVQLIGDPAHLDVAPPSVGKSNQLALEVTGVEPGKPGHARTVAASVQSVTSDARIGRACSAAAQRNQFAGGCEAVGRCRFRRSAGADQERRGGDEEAGGHGAATRVKAGWFLSLLLLAACKPPPEQWMVMPQADAAHGKQVMERVGCGSCHRIPGIHWPQGKVGPALDGLAHRALIAGQLPNRPEVLSAYIRNAPALVPDSGMPAMPVSDEEARDIAAYLYEQGSQ